ncbi:MAG: GWxTD domain-containing protein [Ignavibacteriales bacterium]|nr:GWxTD domain-containing protein [Ignavibacteriales bacterium]
MTRLISCAFLFVLLPLASVAQRIVPKASLVLNLDYASFRHTDQAGYLEIYYGFYPRLVSYELRDNRYSGTITLHVNLTKKEGGEALLNRSFALPISVKDTLDESFNYTFISQAGYSLAFGEYMLSVLAVDSLSPERRDSIRLPVSVTPFRATAISDLELCSNIKESDDKVDPFFKNSMIVVPNPTLVFGVTGSPVMFVYAEVYNVSKNSPYTLKSTITDGRDKTIRESSKSRLYTVSNAVEVNTVNTTSIPSGRYRYHLLLTNAGGEEIGKATKTFYVYNPHLQAAQISSGSLKATELDGLTAEELADEFRRAQYIATDQEMKTFSQVTSAEGRREFLGRFWVEIESGRLGRDPMRRSEYLSRVTLANQRYRVMGKDGWRTDRGRVFILYGESDEVERHPSGESKPYEVWHYYGVENGVEFVFVDRSGFGEYVLVHSTKRGELRDDTWQRFLQ